MTIRPMYEAPLTDKEGLLNFLQMAINKLERGNPREAHRSIGDLVDALDFDIYHVVSQRDASVANQRMIEMLVWVQKELTEGHTWQSLKRLEGMREVLVEHCTVTMPSPETDAQPGCAINVR